MEKQKYFVNIGSQEISQIPYDNNANFTIYATNEDVSLLRKKMDNMHDAGFRSFFRANVPILSYHKDESNDEYDQGLIDACRMIYDLGDDKTREHIKSMGVLEGGYHDHL